MSLGRWTRCVVGLFLLLITACEGDPTGTKQVRAIELSTPSSHLDVGQALPLRARVKNASDETLPKTRIVWSSSDPAIAEVVEGVVTGRIPGTVHIRASAGLIADSVQLTVEPAAVALDVWPRTLHLIQGRAARPLIEIRDSVGLVFSHSYTLTSSSSSSVAVQDGLVRGTGLGSAVVTVAAGRLSVPIQVKVVTGDRYSVSPLPLPAFSSARSINNLGWVLGTRFNGSGNGSRAFLWREGEVVDLDTPARRYTEPVAVNDSGRAVGWSHEGSIPGPWDVWIWRRGASAPIQLPPSIFADGRIIGSAWPVGINIRGQVVGDGGNNGARGDWRAITFAWEGGRGSWLESGRFSGTRAINDRGEILAAGDTQNPGTPVVYSLATGATRLIPAPHPEATRWDAAKVNNHGHVTGTYHWQEPTPSGWKGRWGVYIWDSGRSTTFSYATPGTPWVRGMNDHGEVVGYSPGGFDSPFLIRNARMYDLNELVPPGTPRIAEAWAINDLGQIVAAVAASHGEPRVLLLLTPS